MQLAGYRLTKKLGEGGMGLVFEAEDPRLKRRVAMKVMKPEVALKETHRLRFLREAQAAAAVEHDHIVPILQVGEESGIPFIVMPFLKGEPLDVRLKRGRLDVSEIITIGLQTAEGLAAAHQQGLIHRDIKPANVWLESGSAHAESRQPLRVKILDFGLARISGDEGNLTQSGAIMGTPAYMAPEQARGRSVDHRADLWSLGVMLYEMTTGRRPFTGSDTMAILTALALDIPAPPIAVVPSLPPVLSQVVMKLLEKDPTKRTASAREVVNALQNLLPKNTVIVVTQAKVEEFNPWADIDDDQTDVTPSAKSPALKKPEPPSGKAKPISAKANPVSGKAKPVSRVADKKPVSRDAEALRSASLDGRGSKKKFFIGGAILGLLALVAVVIVIVRDKNGNKIAEVNVPKDGMVEIKDPKTGVTKKVDIAEKKEPVEVALNTPTGKYALEFDGKSRVELPPSLVLAHVAPYTLEAWATPALAQYDEYAGIVRFGGQTSLTVLDREKWSFELQQTSGHNHLSGPIQARSAFTSRVCAAIAKCVSSWMANWSAAKR